MRRLRRTRRSVVLLGVVALVVLAGCAGLGGDDAPADLAVDDTDEPTAPDAYEDALASVDAETASAFEALVTDEDGELTADGHRLVDRLEAAGELGVEERDALVRSVVAVGLDEGTFDVLDVVLASPEGFASEVLREGLADSSGDGLTDGEAAAVGLDPAGDERAVDLALQFRDGGYDETDLAFLERAAGFDEFEWTQAERLGLIPDADVTDDHVAAVGDTAGDGLLDGMAAELGLDPGEAHEPVAEMAATLDGDAFGSTGLAFLERYAEVAEHEPTLEQARYLGVLDAARSQTLTDDHVEAVEDTAGDGLLDGMTAELGLDPAEEYGELAGPAEALAEGGYDRTAVGYLERLGELAAYREHDYQYWAQVEWAGLSNETVANGTVTERDRWKLEDDAGNGLLNGVELAFGTDPEQTDTSGDGYGDHLLWGPMQDLGLEVSPDSPNVFVEVDVAEGKGIGPPSDEQVEAIQEPLAEEPPEEVGPINIQFHVCNTEQEDVVRPEDMFANFDEADSLADLEDGTAHKRNITGLGFQYLLLSDGLVAGGLDGAAPSQAVLEVTDIRNWALVDGRLARNQDDITQAAVIAHELGHVMGIGANDFVGVDSTEVPVDEYDSVMNYNHPFDEVTFSTGEPFDDYEQMADRAFGSAHQDRSELEEMWETGTVDEDALC